jgi:hypothetical protein
MARIATRPDGAHQGARLVIARSDRKNAWSHASEAVILAAEER